MKKLITLLICLYTDCVYAGSGNLLSTKGFANSINANDIASIRKYVIIFFVAFIVAILLIVFNKYYFVDDKNVDLSKQPKPKYEKFKSDTIICLGISLSLLFFSMILGEYKISVGIIVIDLLLAILKVNVIIMRNGLISFFKIKSTIKKERIDSLCEVIVFSIGIGFLLCIVYNTEIGKKVIKSISMRDEMVESPVDKYGSAAFNRMQSCYSNIRVIQSAVEKYNIKYRKTPMRQLDIDELIDSGFLKEKVICPENKSNKYISLGNLTKDGEISCGDDPLGNYIYDEYFYDPLKGHGTLRGRERSKRK